MPSILRQTKIKFQVFLSFGPRPHEAVTAAGRLARARATVGVVAVGVVALLDSGPHEAIPARGVLTGAQADHVGR